MKQLGKTAAFWAAVLLAWELAFHAMVYGVPSARFLGALPFTAGAAGLLAVLSHLWQKPLANKVLRFMLLTALLLVFSVQTVYYHVFGSLLSLAYVGMGGQAIGNFGDMVISGIRDSVLYLALYLLPFPILALLQRRGALDCGRVAPAAAVVMACCAVMVSALGTPAVGEGPRSAAYYDVHSTADRQVEYFGLLTAERLDLARLMNDSTGALTSGADLQDGGGTERNIMPEMDFEALEAAAEKDAIQELNQYFSSLSGTAKNEYTGLFEGYNYIEICAEAYSPYLVDPEITPTLYRLTHEGVVFENFYNSFPSVTSNGEYSMCMGLMPDISRLSFATSMDNYVPFTLAHMFRQQEGRYPIAYHNNYATFYNRINTHTNMGYDFRAIDYGLDMEKGNPASDLEMMEKSVDDFIGNEPFAVHYMTYSGHAPYNFTTNDMCVKNRARAEAMGLDCSEEVLAYYACQLELEDALTYLLARVEEAGIAGHTVIVLSGDHYPYGLSDAAYQELAGDAVDEDPFWRYRNSFVCWTGALEEPIPISSYCCTQDILPTVCNLFGLTYESRMLTGTDVLSDSTHVALLLDGSFLTDALTYDSSSGQITWHKTQEDYPEGYDRQLIQATKNQFSAAAAILRTNYFGFVFSTLELAESTAPVITDRASFSDINGLWYEDSVEILIGRGALSGNNNGRFSGENECTRAMFMTMLSRSLYLTPEDGKVPPFTDVAEDAWFYSYIAAGWGAGILPTEDTFRPDDPITQEEARAIFASASEYAGISSARLWSDSVVDSVLERARKEGEADGAFTRGMAAAVIAYLVERTE